MSADDAPTPKRFRSLSPDVTVVVGKGDAKKEFGCYKALLLKTAPDYFDAMFSAKMVENESGRIEFPEESPSGFGQFHQVAVDHDAALTQENAAILAPWFHRFQMEAELKRCDDILCQTVLTLSTLRKEDTGRPTGPEWLVDKRVWDKPTSEEAINRKGQFWQIIRLLQLSSRFNLKKTLEHADTFIDVLMGKLFVETHDLFVETDDLGEYPVIKILVGLSLPLAQNEPGSIEYEIGNRFEPTGNANSFFLSLMPILPDLYTLSLDTLNNNDEMLPLLISETIKREVAQMKLRELQRTNVGDQRSGKQLRHLQAQRVQQLQARNSENQQARAA